MTKSELKEQALTHLEVYADLITSTQEYCSRSNFMIMAAGALAILEDLQIIDNETAEDYRKKYINWWKI